MLNVDSSKIELIYAEDNIEKWLPLLGAATAITACWLATRIESIELPAT
ncbi:hypothetical protein [Nitrosospira sp. NpAV]|nr:hypothetical protein [Nitrosospira sp. NpAV]